MLSNFNRSVIAMTIMTASSIPLCAHADPYSDVDVQRAYEQGYQRAIKQISAEQAKARAAVDKEVAMQAPAARPAAPPVPKAALVDMKETYSDAGDHESIQRFPVQGGGTQQVERPSTAVAQDDADDVPETREDQLIADVSALTDEIHKLRLGVASDDTQQSKPAAPQQLIANAPPAPSLSVPVEAPAVVAAAAPPRQVINTQGNYYPDPPSAAMPPPPWVSRSEPAPDSGRHLVWSREYRQWVALTN